MRKPLIMSVLVAAALAFAAPAFAHPHVAQPAHQGAGQVLAHGQLHGSFNGDTGDPVGDSCDGDPAAYGLESAHHGPDSGTPGNADGCYRVDSMPPSSDDQNPAIN